MNIQINKLPDPLQDGAFVCIDTELFGAERHRLHRPTGRFACMQLATSPEDVFVYTDEKIIPLVLGRIDNAVWVFHNAQFDLQHLRRWDEIKPRTKLWCTMIMEKILWSGYFDRFSLKDLDRRYCDIYMEKEVRDRFEKAERLDDDMIQYAAGDVSDLYKILLKQKEVVKQNPWAFKIWKEVDCPALWAYLEFQGFRLDVKAWEEMATNNQTRADELKASFDFNPASPKQVKDKLNSMGCRVSSTGVDILESWIGKSPDKPASEVARNVLDFRKVAKLASTYGMNFIDKYLEQENDYFVIYSNIHVTGASSGRNSSSDPNMQNIPAREYPEYRKPWIARPNHKLVIADYSSQEPRVSAYLSQDKNLLEIFRSGKDPYIEIAKRVHGKEITKDDPFRDAIKTDFLAASYGQYPKDSEHAERLNKFFDYFSGLDEWCKKQRSKTKYVESVMGRRLWLNPYNDQSERNALNHPMQGTSADMMKLAIAKSYQNWNFDCPFGFVLPVHDEAILDVPETVAQDVAEFVEECMVSVAEEMCPGVPFLAKAAVCNSWSEK